MSLAINGYTPRLGPMTGASAGGASSAADAFLPGGGVDGASSIATPPTVKDASAAARNSGASKAMSDFQDYANKTPAQRMRDAILKSMGLSEDDLKAMSPEKRKAVEDAIARKIKERAEEAAKKGKTGLVADITA